MPTPRTGNRGRLDRGSNRFLGLVALLVVLANATSTATAHEGPPFPIFVDRPAGNCLVSVWADPDIGEATFFVILESSSGGPPEEVKNVSMWVEPKSGRLPRATYPAVRQVLRNQVQFFATPDFDQRDFWTVGFQITDSRGQTSELTHEVESTPPGYGRWGLLIYLFPFALLGGLWVAAMLRRRQIIREYAARSAQDAAPSKPNDLMPVDESDRS